MRNPLRIVSLGATGPRGCLAVDRSGGPPHLRWDIPCGDAPLFSSGCAGTAFGTLAHLLPEWIRAQSSHLRPDCLSPPL
eukprot:5862808-Heterocapsa_arctica.AAC.1